MKIYYKYYYMAKQKIYIKKKQLMTMIRKVKNKFFWEKINI